MPIVGESGQDVFVQLNTQWWEGGKIIKPGETFEPRQLDTPLDEMVRKQGGRRSQTKSKTKRGRYIQARPSPRDSSDVALDATLRAAAPYQRQRKELKEIHKVAFAVRREDFQKKVRVRKTANLILFLVDGSWSMAVAERMKATKSAILSLLTDAYQRRDRVGLVVFAQRAMLQCPLTSDMHVVDQVVADLAIGGQVLVSDAKGTAHSAVIGRTKIERRPLLLVEAAAGKSKVSLMIRFLKILVIIDMSG